MRSNELREDLSQALNSDHQSDDEIGPGKLDDEHGYNSLGGKKALSQVPPEGVNYHD